MKSLDICNTSLWALFCTSQNVSLGIQTSVLEAMQDCRQKLAYVYSYLKNIQWC